MTLIFFTPLKEIDTSKQYENIISCSLFRMKDSYRDFGIYVHLFLQWFPKIPRNSYVRLYVDSTVLNHPEYKKIEKLHNLEIILFEAPEFMDKDGFHDGTFGTMVRFYPLFYKPKNVKYIWVTDLDNRSYTFNSTFIRSMKRQNAKVFYFSMSCYRKPWAEVAYPIIGGRIIMRRDVTLNKGNFTRFLNDTLEGKYSKVFDRIKLLDQQRKNPKQFENVRYFPYGFDELFLNKYVYPEFMKQKRIIHFSFYTSPENLGFSESIQKEYKDLNSKSWLRNLSQTEYKRLMKLNDMIYNQLDDSSDCKKEYIDHKKYLSRKSEDAGVYAVLVKRSNQE